MVCVVLLDEILHDGARLEQVDLFSIAKRIRDGWDTAIRIDASEPVFFLRVLRDIDVLGRVW